MQPSRGPLLIFESHPIQYRVPVYRRMQELVPGAFKVVFATDCSSRGHHDAGFGREIAWGMPMLGGFDQITMYNCRNPQLVGRSSLHGSGVADLLHRHRPAAVLLNGLYYHFDLAVYWHALRMKIPVRLRCETQDQAFGRGAIKEFIRQWVYRMLYRRIERFYFIGELNRRHYVAHGVPAKKLHAARYCVRNPLEGVPVGELQARREAMRSRLGIPAGRTLYGFFGKLIYKKGPDLLLAAWQKLPARLRENSALVYVGAGDMERDLRARAQGGPVMLTGFIDQQHLADYYLAVDVLVLPSRQMGETWGLVVNEALNAGCRIIVSSACGCAGDFRSLADVAVVAPERTEEIAREMEVMWGRPRDFRWAADFMERYSVNAVAEALIAE